MSILEPRVSTDSGAQKHSVLDTLGFPSNFDRPCRSSSTPVAMGAVVKPGDPVQSIPRCGPVKAQRLAELGVLTVHDLLNYQGVAPQGVNIAQLKATAEQMLALKKPQMPRTVSKGLHTSNHSWYGMTVHATVGKSIRRVIVQDLVVLDHAILLAVCWFAKGSWQSKMVSPMALLAIHILWKQQCVVSSSDGEYSVTTHYHSDDVEIRHPLRVHEEQWILTESQQRALKFTLREIESVQKFSILALLNVD